MSVYSEKMCEFLLVSSSFCVSFTKVFVDFIHAIRIHFSKCSTISRLYVILVISFVLIALYN